MLWVAFDLGAVAVAAQVWADHGVVFCQTGRNLVPHGVGLRVAVEHQQRRAGAALDQVDCGAVCFYLKLFKTLKHRYFSFKKCRLVGGS